MKKDDSTSKKVSSTPVSRREALEKAGKYAVFTAAASILLLSPKKAVASSGPLDPGWGNNFRSNPGSNPVGNNPVDSQLNPQQKDDLG